MIFKYFKRMIFFNFRIFINMLDEGFQAVSFNSSVCDVSSHANASDIETAHDLSSGAVFSVDFHKYV